MNARTIIGTLLIFYAGLNSAFAADVDIHHYLKKMPAPNDVREYWTPERLSNAKNLIININPNRIIKLSYEEFRKQQQDKKTVSAEGSPPTLSIEAHVNYLYHPKIKKNVRATCKLDAGVLNQPYSSSQLIPVSADLVYPYRTTGRLFFTIPGQGDFVCSASTIQSRIVLTAGHCVHSGMNDTNGFYTNFLFVPAFRNGNAPYQSWTASFVTATDTWINSGGVLPNPSDVGMLEIADQTINGNPTKIGSVTGWLGWQTNSLMPNHVNMLGYACNLDNCQLLHQVSSQSATAISPNNVQYGSDLLGGADGGPWLQNFGLASAGQTGGNAPAMNKVVGLTSIGFVDATQKSVMSPILDNSFVMLLNAICNHQANNCSQTSRAK